jgi:hypothetical protein
LLKEYIVRRKLSEYLRLLMMQVFKEAFGDEDIVYDLTAETCDLLGKLVEQFGELHADFACMFSEDNLLHLGVTEVV